LETVRTVEDRVKSVAGGRQIPEGTKVSEEALANDPDTLFPLQGALGYDLTQTLFVGTNTLLVEGPSDILYLQVVSQQLGKRKRNTLNSAWTLCPAGGIDKIQSFVSLFSGQNLHIGAITDFAKGDRQKLKNLEQTRLLEDGRLKTFASILGKAEADVEDIFSPETYAAMLNQAFGLSGANQLDADKLLAAAPNTERLVKKAEECFRVMSTDAPQFDHFTPAMWLLRNPEFLDGKGAGTGVTLDNAELVIDAINQMLPS
jgi:hypothetical protein